MKEGNTIDEARELRSQAAELQTKSYEYLNLSNSATSQANAYLNQAAEYESSFESQTRYNEHLQEQAMREEQSRAQAEELRKQEFINNEIENKKRITDAESQYEYIKNKLLDYQSLSQDHENSLNQRIQNLDRMRDEINQKLQIVDDIRKQANQAQERRQENWEVVYQNLDNTANNSEIEIRLLINNYNSYQNELFNAQNKLNEINEIVRQLEIEIQKDELRNPELINQTIKEIENNSQNKLHAESIKTKLAEAKFMQSDFIHEINRLREEMYSLNNSMNETQAILDILIKESNIISDLDNSEIKNDLQIQQIHAKNRIIQFNNDIIKRQRQLSEMENKANNGNNTIIDLEIQLRML